MKKRAQTPDAYTYTIIFRGCTEHPEPAQALAKVITIYTSMLNDKAPIHPNTIHMNAVLKMCARADDMEALFAISDQMRAKGMRSPNMVTYSIVLNAIRLHAFNSLRGDLTPVQRRQIRQDANIHARRIWRDVVKRWRQGDFAIDESLMCTMGRILLLGVEQDVDDVLSLIEQTMNVPRQARSLRSRNSQEVNNVSTNPDERRITTSPGQDELRLEETDPFALAKTSTNSYAKPGQNTLSLLMEALLDLRLKEPATKYWEILTKAHAVDPDAGNYHAYLRVLRLHRAGTETVKMLLKMPASYMEAKTFRIAMSTCRRDINNQHAFANAGKVLDIMQSTVATPDPKVISEYLHIAFSTNASDVQGASLKYAKGKQIMRALDRINPSYVNLRSLVAYGDPTKPTAMRGEKQALIESVLELTRNLIRAHDILLHNQMVTREQSPNLIAQRSKLAAFITRFRDRKDGTSRLATPKTAIESLDLHRHGEKTRDIQKGIDGAKNDGSEAHPTFRGEFSGKLSRKANEVEKEMKVEHEANVKGTYTERFAEEERRAAEASLA